AQMQEGGVIERLLAGQPDRPFTMTARLENGHPKIVVRRGNPRPRPAVVAAEAPAPPAVEPPPPSRPPPPDARVTAPPRRAGLPEAIGRALDAGVARQVSDVILS